MRPSDIKPGRLYWTRQRQVVRVLDTTFLGPEDYRVVGALQTVTSDGAIMERLAVFRSNGGFGEPNTEHLNDIVSPYRE